MASGDVAAPARSAGLTEPEFEAVRDAFRGSALLSVLDDDEIRRLLADARLVSLEPGDYLFHQGDLSDSVYVATAGVLSAILEGETGRGQAVGAVRAGESVGEMGVLTDAPRSLAIVARTRATLVRIEGASFQAVCLRHPTLLLKVVHVISARNRETLRVLSPFRQAQTVVVAPLHESGLVDAFLRTLDERVRASGRFDPATPGEARPTRDPAAARERPRVLTLGAVRASWSDVCLEAPDRVLLVADAARFDADLTETAARLLDPAALPGQVERELVLVRETGRPCETSRWLARSAFTRHHHVAAADEGDLRRLLRHLGGQSVSLVLSGGGVRGWVHLGAMRALEERHVPLDGIGGSSIGAAVSACRLVHGSVEGATRSFARIARAIAKSKGFGSLTYPTVSILNGRRWTHALQEEFGDREIEDFPLPFFAVSCNLSRSEQAVHRRGLVWEAVRASSSLPALLPPFVQEGQLFVDGGIVNNIPVDVARVVMGGGCRTIAIELSGTGERDTRAYRFPPVLTFVDTLLARLRLGRREFQFISIGEVTLRALTHGSLMRTNENLRGADVVLRPAFPNQGFLSASDPDALVELGYRSMLAQLDASGDFS